MATTFTVMTYPEHDDCLAACEWAKEKGLEYIYILHDKDKLKDGTPEESHYHSLIRTGNDMTLSAFSKNTGLSERWIRERNNWKESALYLLHRSKKAINDERKYKYPVEELMGDERLMNKVKKLLENSQGKSQLSSKEDDRGILQIIDFIDSFDYLTTACLVRWCCENGLYSVYRRAGRIVSDVLSEHNRSCEFTLKDTLYQMKLQDLEKRLSEQEKAIERAYGDFWQRQINPFNGQCIAGEKEVDMVTIKDLIKGA